MKYVLKKFSYPSIWGFLWHFHYIQMFIALWIYFSAEVKYSVSKLLLLLVLSAHMYVLAFQDQQTVPKWNILSQSCYFCLLFPQSALGAQCTIKIYGVDAEVATPYFSWLELSTLNFGTPVCIEILTELCSCYVLMHYLC